MGAWGSYQKNVQRIEDFNGMKAGPFYDVKRGELRIPSYIFNRLAVEEWKLRGLRYDHDRQEWYYPIAPAHAVEQVERARIVFNQIWNFEN